MWRGLTSMGPTMSVPVDETVLWLQWEIVRDIKT